MLFKVALRNIQRSIKDYAIYFVTLLIAITVFYAFNSISDQQVLQEISSSTKTSIVEFTGFMMGIFSVVVALVLGFLVIYANQLLIRRRKREFGMYFTLGMRAGQVSRIILYETVLVGIVSLILGLALGVLVSQLLSFATAALFGIPMPDYQFTFSMRAFVMTLLCFVAIYVVVAIFNVFSIRRCKLIDLITADSKNQKVMIRNPWICLVLFIVSLGILGVAYWQLQLNGMTFIGDDHFTIATVLMFVGTLLLFFSLAGFIVATITRARGFYLKKLRPFTTRQVASKMNTSFVSVWIVCILLFFAITTFTTGMALVEAFVGDIDEANPYDSSVITMQAVIDGKEDQTENTFDDVSQTEEYLKNNLEGFDDLVAASASLELYHLTDMTYGDVMAATETTLNDGSMVDSQYVEVAGLSQYNEALALQGKPAVSLADDEYLVTNNMQVSEHIAQAMADQSLPLEIAGTTLKPLSRVDRVQLYDFDILSNAVTIVVPDRVIEAGVERGSLGIIGSYVNFNYKAGSNADEVFLDRIMETQCPGITNFLSRAEMVAQASGLRMAITYLALYIGLVLLVAVAAVLAIQLLSLTNDSLTRYRTLSRLGCDMRMISRSLFAQVLLYFILPLVVAVCHSAWTINIMSGTLFDVLGVNIIPSVVMAAGFILLIYGGYLLITYFAARATVKQSLKEAR